MDGVLVDAKEWHFEAFNRALKEFGFPEVTLDEHINIYDGLPTKDKLKKMLSLKGTPPESVHNAINDLKQKYTEEITNVKCVIDSNRISTLNYLKEKGYKIACCSNSIRRTIEYMLGKVSLLKYMDFILSNEDVVNSKPNPEIYNKAIKKMGLKPQEVLIFEDNINGINAAKSSGSNLFIVENKYDLSLKKVIDHIKKIENE